MEKFSQIFGTTKPVIGMIHIPALPGTPQNTLNPKEIINSCIEEAKIYWQCGIHSIMIENMHDIPYLNKNTGHEISSLMAIIGYEVKKSTHLPVGIQILAGANLQAIAVAHSAGLDFIRAEGFVFGHLADEGYMDSCAGELLRYRKQIGADKILIFTDIKKKHSSHAVTNDISIEETAKSAQFFCSDGIIVTGISTGKEPDIDELTRVKQAVSLPVLSGSGLTVNNLEKYYSVTDGFIIGSWFKTKGLWKNKPDKERINQFMKKIKSLQRVG